MRVRAILWASLLLVIGLMEVACSPTETDPGGTGGSGGAAGTGGQTSGGAGGLASCDDLIRRASAELQQAQSCDLRLNRVTCVDTVLSLCDCPVIIDMAGTPAVKAYLATKAELEARKDCFVGCPAVLCRTPGPGRCLPPDSGVIGTCVDSTLSGVSDG